MINMKIIVNRKTLLNVLKDISKINKRSNVKIVTNNNCIELIVTHNYVSHTFKLDSVILEQGEFKLTWYYKYSGYRMVVHTIKDVDMNSLDNVVIYGEDLKITEKFIKKNSNDLIKINVYSDRVEFILDNKKLSARIIEGEFIGYNKLIPDNHTTEFNL